MNDAGRWPPGFAESLVAAGTALHGIASRTDAAQVAAEVVRLNDAVRRAAAGRASPYDHPADFAALLLANADPVNHRPGR
jgi:aspartyl-tRNA(Asn)/glutamyl-tRNA(Gln) amidotransferase subunit A